MVYVKPLHAVTQNELQAVGYRCQDLALLHQNQIPIAGSFVVLSNAMDETIRLNNLKYKIDYVMSHAQAQIQSSLQNVYSSARKALLEAKLPPGFDAEVRSIYDSITQPLAIGELVAERPAVRIIMSTNRIDDPESNDNIIQNINSFDELLIAIREAWALSWHPTFLSQRLIERFPENRLKVALIIQTMDEPTTSVHAYSCLPQDHKKIYLQVYHGLPDLREKITKDYYAISKETMHIVATQVKPQPSALVRNDAKELAITPVTQTPGDKMADRDLAEIARLTKKAERVLQQPVKAFFVNSRDMHELIWVNRLGFDVMIDQGDAVDQGGEQITQSVDIAPVPSPEPIAQEQVTPPTPGIDQTPPLQTEPIAMDTPAQNEQQNEQIENPGQTDDFIVESPTQGATQNADVPKVGVVAAKLLLASLRIVHQVVERKYRSEFGETDTIGNVADAINRLNSANVFSRNVDGALLLQAEEAAKNESNITEEEYAKAIEEVAYLLNYA